MDLTKLTCCPENVTYSKTWVNYGMSTCTMEIIGTLVVLLYTLIFGTHHLWKYKIRKTDIDCDKMKISGLYLLQILLLLLMPILSLLNVILQAHHIYGHVIISTISTLIIYPYSIFILRVERHKILSNQSNSHGIVLLGFWILSFIMETIIFIHSSNEEEWSLKWITGFSQSDTAVSTLRYVSSLLIFSLGLFASGDTGIILRYSSVKDDNKIGSAFHQSSAFIGSSSYAKTWYKFKSLAIFLWPKEDILLQIRMILSFALLFSGNIVNALRPLYEKKIIDSVTEFPGQFRWELVVIYVGIDVFQEIASDLKAFLWNPVEHYTACKVEVEIFRHLHSLSLRWHLERKTGEVLRMMDRGTSAIHSLMYYILFDILPLIADTVLAIIFFISIFDKWLGLIVFMSMIFYLILTIGVTEWRSKIQEQKNEAENNQKSRSIDSLLNFETVKYYGAESYEVETYKKAILDSQRQETLSDTTSYFFDILRNLIDNFAILTGSLLCLYMIVTNQGLTIGDYALFTSYISQLQRPLTGFSFSYRCIYESFVDMDSLFSLFEEKQEVSDLPDAERLKIDEGRIQFSNVSFSYKPEKPVLKNVNFSVPPGKTIALVGPSGAGKSTTVRLLFRFYDVNEGRILIDGQDVKTVKQDSLRQAIGVVPQDTVLFNDTIKFNIQYGKIDASDEEVIEAAKNADIHDRILTFPDGYKTEVGERGLRLSGGEKQRVAIARTILKAPKIVLLDEATSALDTQTERNIQAALKRVCANRTTIIIAHRLSTIIHADEILVLKEGEIVERGRHEDLLLQCGVYHKMWEAQFTKEEENTEGETVNDMSELLSCQEKNM